MRKEQGTLHRIITELAGDKKLGGRIDTQPYIEELAKIYGANFRHSYSMIFGVIARLGADSELENLQSNMQSIQRDVDLLQAERIWDADVAVYNKICKFIDHVNLDIARVNYTKSESAKMLQIFNKENGDILSKVSTIDEKAERMQREYITILGIFSSIVVAFVAGMTFSGSVLNNIDKASIYRIILIISAISLMLFNLVNLLLSFISDINETDKHNSERVTIINKVNSVLNTVVFLDVIAWLIYWYRFS